MSTMLCFQRAIEAGFRAFLAHSPRALTLSGYALALSAATGCATAPGVYGERARYSPAFEGYVMAVANGSDDPGAGDAVLLLRDPLTGSKLRCQEQVLQWRELHEDLAVDAVHDENVAVAVSIVSGSTFGPMMAMYPVGGLVLAEAIFTTEALYQSFDSDDATELLAGGITLYRRTRYPQAAALIERALAKDGRVGLLDKAYLYLGLAYAQIGNEERARTALTLFVERAAVRDVDAYREAHATLGDLGVTAPACESLAPVELHW